MEQTFLYVEDYIEYIAGWRTRDGRQLGLFQNVQSPLSLARYDVHILDSLGQQTALSKKPYTDKQAALAVKIVTKYKKQLSNLITPVYIPDTMNYRLGIREVDRTRSITLNDNNIFVKFPFDTKLIEELKKLSTQNFGTCKWDHQNKVWTSVLTEFNLNWIVAVGKNYKFEIDQQLLDLLEKINEVEKCEHRIELVKGLDGNYKISNAESTLVDYLEKKLGRNCWKDLIGLCDNAQVCGYTISKEVEQELENKIKPDYYRETVNFIKNRKFGVAKEEFKHVLDYARLSNRLPVHLYDPDASDQVSNNEIIYLNRMSRDPDHAKNIKLLVTHSSLLIGSRRQSWAQNAEKIIELL